MSEFQSPVARKWVAHVLYYVEALERLAASAPDELLSATLKGADRESRSLGELLSEAGMAIGFSIGSTVELTPSMGRAVDKSTVLNHLLRGRKAIWSYCKGLDADDVSRVRSTVLHPTSGTFVEMMVVLVAQLNRLLGRALDVARLNGHTFDMTKPGDHPLPYSDPGRIPGLPRLPQA